jgi:hypothetical protein
MVAEEKRFVQRMFVFAPVQTTAEVALGAAPRPSGMLREEKRGAPYPAHEPYGRAKTAVK